MEIKKIIVGTNSGFFVNTYFIIKNKNTIIVDPGDENERLKELIKENNLTPKFVLLTHAHIDHIKDVKIISDCYEIPVYIHIDDKLILESNDNNLSSIFGIPFQGVDIKRYLKDNEEIEFEGEKLQIIHTPGHTPGGICIKGDDFLLSGDTLFANSIGRTDFPYGSEELLMKSIKEKLFILNEDLKVYPGHNEETTIGVEKRNWGVV